MLQLFVKMSLEYKLIPRCNLKSADILKAQCLRLPVNFEDTRAFRLRMVTPDPTLKNIRRVSPQIWGRPLSCSYLRSNTVTAHAASPVETKTGETLYCYAHANFFPSPTDRLSYIVFTLSWNHCRHSRGAYHQVSAFPESLDGFDTPSSSRKGTCTLREN